MSNNAKDKKRSVYISDGDLDDHDKVIFVVKKSCEDKRLIVMKFLCKVIW